MAQNKAKATTGLELGNLSPIFFDRKNILAQVELPNVLRDMINHIRTDLALHKPSASAKYKFTLAFQCYMSPAQVAELLEIGKLLTQND